MILTRNVTVWDATKPIGLCCDHAGFELKEAILGWLQESGIEYLDYGAYTDERSDYPDFAHKMAYAMNDGLCMPCIAICGSGNGLSMTLNKHPHIRAALCWSRELARLARTHNDANVLVLPARFTSLEESYEMVRLFLETPFEGGRHQQRVDKIPC